MKKRRNMTFSLPKLIFLFSLCSFIFASLAENGDPIQTICKKSRNPEFCFEFFKPDHGATLQNLALKAVNNAEESGSRTSELLNTVIKQTTDPTLRGKYQSCWRNYNDVISILELASRSINDPKGFNGKVFNAENAIAACNKGLGGTPVNPPELNAENEKVSNLCSIAIVISNLL